LHERYLQGLPWEDQRFDAFIVVLENRDLGETERNAVARITRLNNDWVETCGYGAEQLHDQIDEISVSIGRQEAIGDGNPMTAWHEDLVSPDDVIDYLALGGLGSSDFKLVCLVAPDDQTRPLLERLREKLRPGTTSRS